MNLLKLSYLLLSLAEKIKLKKKKKKKDINKLDLGNENGSSRPTYHSSFDRSSYNYGYMTESEMSGPSTDNIWT